MNYIEHRTNYFHLDGPNLRCHKQIESQQLQSTVDVFKAKGGKIDVIPMGYSTYLNNLDDKNKQRFGRSQK